MDKVYGGAHHIDASRASWNTSNTNATARIYTLGQTGYMCIVHTWQQQQQ